LDVGVYIVDCSCVDGERVGVEKRLGVKIGARSGGDGGSAEEVARLGGYGDGVEGEYDHEVARSAEVVDQFEAQNEVRRGRLGVGRGHDWSCGVESPDLPQEKGKEEEKQAG
jgi:hypothetical protein